jgi:flagellar motility protein MotE (MotC chaperone)
MRWQKSRKGEATHAASMTWQPVAGAARRVREMRAVVICVFITLFVGVGLAINALPAGAQGTSEPGEARPQQRGTEQLVVLLDRRERALQRREDTLKAREADLRAAEGQLTERLAELEGLRNEIREMLVELDGERETRVLGLVKMFESMRPNQAALILAETEEEVALEVLMRMNRSKAGQALARMNPVLAAKFTQRLGAPPLSQEVP